MNTKNTKGLFGFVRALAKPVAKVLGTDRSENQIIIDPEMTLLEKDFHAACLHYWDFRRYVSPEDQLNLYGLYKQACFGDCMLMRPTVFQRKKLYKYIAWKARQGMSTEDAAIQYIDSVKFLDENLGSNRSYVTNNSTGYHSKNLNNMSNLNSKQRRDFGANLNNTNLNVHNLSNANNMSNFKNNAFAFSALNSEQNIPIHPVKPKQIQKTDSDSEEMYNLNLMYQSSTNNYNNSNNSSFTSGFNNLAYGSNKEIKPPKSTTSSGKQLRKISQEKANDRLSLELQAFLSVKEESSKQMMKGKAFAIDTDENLPEIFEEQDIEQIEVMSNEKKDSLLLPTTESRKLPKHNVNVNFENGNSSLKNPAAQFRQFKSSGQSQSQDQNESRIKTKDMRLRFQVSEDEYKRFTRLKLESVRIEFNNQESNRNSAHSQLQQSSSHGSFGSFKSFSARHQYLYRGKNIHELVADINVETSLVRAAYLTGPYSPVLPVVYMIASKYMIILEHYQNSSAMQQKTQTLDEFSGMFAPRIPVDVFILRLVRYLDKWFYEAASVNSVGVRSLLITTIYMARIEQKMPELRLTSFNIHRLLAVCMLLAAKFCEDSIIANNFWAEVSGVTRDELNHIEEVFCSKTSFDLYVSQNLLDKTYEEYDMVKL